MTILNEYSTSIYIVGSGNFSPPHNSGRNVNVIAKRWAAHNGKKGENVQQTESST